MYATPRTRSLVLAVVLTAAVGCADDLGGEEPFGDAGPSPDGGGATLDADPDAGIDAGPVEPTIVDEITSATPFEPGPYTVGWRDWDITYDAIGETGRELRLAVWYPTADTEGFPARYSSLLTRQEIIREASVAVDEPMPMLVFSHGNGGMAEQSYFMMEFFASHGFVVVSPDHTGNTFREVQNVDLSSAPLRPQDITAVIDEMTSLPQADPLHGRVSDDIILSGHSCGGFTTLANAGAVFAVDDMLEACDRGEVEPTLCETFDGEQIDAFRAGFLDDRVDVAIPQAPGGAFAFEDFEAIDMPFLLFTGGLDNTTPNVSEGNPIWNDTDAPAMRLDLPRAGHFTFSNMCDVFSFIDHVKNDGCSEEFIDPAIAYDIVNVYSLAYARYHLWDDESVANLIEGGGDEPFEDHVIIRRR